MRAVRSQPLCESSSSRRREGKPAGRPDVPGGLPCPAQCAFSGLCLRPWPPLLHLNPSCDGASHRVGRPPGPHAPVEQAVAVRRGQNGLRRTGGSREQAEGSHSVRHFRALQEEGESESLVSIFQFALVGLLGHRLKYTANSMSQLQVTFAGEACSPGPPSQTHGISGTDHASPRKQESWNGERGFGESSVGSMPMALPGPSLLPPAWAPCHLCPSTARSPSTCLGTPPCTL